MYTLVVVDVQTHFSAKEEMDFTQNIQREIKRAIQDSAHIVFVEYNYSGPTLTCLVELTKGYGKTHTIEKGNNDGSRELLSLVKEEKLPTYFLITGINTDFCVAATVEGLSNKLPDASIEVLWDCCASLWYSQKPALEHHTKGIKKMAKLPNVSITKEPTDLSQATLRAIEAIAEMQ